MAQTALPAYCDDWSLPTASLPPGHKFLLYGKVLQSRDRFEIVNNASSDNSKNGASSHSSGARLDFLNYVTSNSQAHKGLFDEIDKRNSRLFNRLSENQRFSKSLKTAAPLATGLGIEHPIENGFAFLSPYGFPYLAGSSVKGVFRSIALELANESDSMLSATDIDILFGRGTETSGRQGNSRGRSLETSLKGSEGRGALTFWDVLFGPEMKVEIMTPHHQDYFLGGNSLPTDEESPIPIMFLAVPPSSPTTLRVSADLELLRSSDLRNTWKSKLDHLIDVSYEFGFGAKSSVGYGYFVIDKAAENLAEQSHIKELERIEAEAAAARERVRLASLPDSLRELEQFWKQNGLNRPNTKTVTRYKKALEEPSLGQYRLEIALRAKEDLANEGNWKEVSKKNNPAKDEEHQLTLLVIDILQGGLRD